MYHAARRHTVLATLQMETTRFCWNKRNKRHGYHWANPLLWTISLRSIHHRRGREEGTARDIWVRKTTNDRSRWPQWCCLAITTSRDYRLSSKTNLGGNEGTWTSSDFWAYWRSCYECSLYWCIFYSQPVADWVRSTVGWCQPCYTISLFEHTCSVTQWTERVIERGAERGDERVTERAKRATPRAKRANEREARAKARAIPRANCWTNGGAQRDEDRDQSIEKMTFFT